MKKVSSHSVRQVREPNQLYLLFKTGNMILYCCKLQLTYFIEPLHKYVLYIVEEVNP